MFVDLDRFKVVNDGLGHDAGDMLLVVMATRIGDVIRGRGLAARLGGDEFAILVCDASEEGVRSTSEQIATEIVSALGAPVQLGARQITTFASVGIAVAPAQDAAGTLLRCADIAMYQAKRSGGAQHRFFRGDDDAEARQRMDVEIWLRDAIEGERLGVVYQPIVALDGRGLIGFEALVRGHHPERGTLVPGQFLNVASEIGLLPKIDFWVMARGLRQLAAWRAQGAVDLRLSVNVSGRTLGQPGTLERVLEVVRDSNVPPENLTLEVTESEMLHDLPGATELLVNLRRAGVRVAIDDFGTGYSSLSQLAALPLDVLKIDRTFISRIAETGRDIEMVRMILALARGLRVEAVAEGVEDSMQANTLRSMGCEAGQGYLFSPPVDFAAATQMVMREAHRAVTAA
jgi:diguanylate cyclase (GGDEF)-like protein